MQKFFDVDNSNFVLQYAGGEYARMGATENIAALVTKYSAEFRKRKIIFCLPGRIKGKDDLRKKDEIKI